MADDFLSARVVRIVNESPIVKRYFLLFEGEESFTYAPGQFVMLNLPIRHEFTTRSYSIASAPDGSNLIELCVVLKEDGAGTPYLFKDIKEGSVLQVSPAQGRFVLNETIDTDVCFIATGTGVAPLRSMVKYIYDNNLPHKNLHLVFGNRTQQDILYRSEFEQLASKHSDFHFHPVLSRDESADWHGAKGYVHPIYKQLFADVRPATFYICGWSNMVREAKNSLKEMGYGRKQINFELYD